MVTNIKENGHLLTFALTFLVLRAFVLVRGILHNVRRTEEQIINAMLYTAPTYRRSIASSSSENKRVGMV